MGFDISLNIGANATSPTLMQQALLNQFLNLEDFYLNEETKLGRLWEIDAVEGHWADAIITAWPDSIDFALRSTPKISCDGELDEIQPLLDFLISHGYIAPDRAELLSEYEQQRQRVEIVRRIVSQE